MESAPLILFVLGGLALKAAGLFVIVYFGTRLAIRHERGA